MRLTQHTDHALRVLMYLGANEGRLATTGEGRLATTGEVAARYGISHHHLTKVVNRLGHAGFVETVRGRSGGIRLARAPAEIMVGDVVRRTEPAFDVAGCPGGRAGACPLAPDCVLKGALCGAAARFLEALDDVPLSSLIGAA